MRRSFLRRAATCSWRLASTSTSVYLKRLIRKSGRFWTFIKICRASHALWLYEKQPPENFLPAEDFFCHKARTRGVDTIESRENGGRWAARPASQVEREGNAR